MNSPLNPEEISRLAADIRTIQDYTQSQGFDKTLLRAEVTTPRATSKLKDTPIICAVVSVALLMGCLLIMAYVDGITGKTFNLVFVTGLLFITSATMSIHKKFSDGTITTVSAVGLLAVLLIGAGVYTPKEAAAIAQQYKKEESK